MSGVWSPADGIVVATQGAAPRRRSGGAGGSANETLRQPRRDAGPGIDRPRPAGDARPRGRLSIRRALPAAAAVAPAAPAPPSRGSPRPPPAPPRPPPPPPR